MIEALIDGERRGPVLAELARGKMRAKIPDLSMALEGRFGDHHALMCRLHLDHTGHLDAMIARLDAQVEAMMTPFRTQRDLLATTPGIGQLAAAGVICEIGVSVREFFTTDARLASWTGLCPGNNESAGKRRSARRRHGNEHLQSLLVECAWSAVRHDGYLKSLYHRHVMEWGGYRSQIAKKKAIVVVAHALIVIIWHILATGKPYHELGADYFTSRLDPERETRRLIARLEALGPSSQPPASRRLTPRPAAPGSASAPPGAAACPAEDHSRIRVWTGEPVPMTSRASATAAAQPACDQAARDQAGGIGSCACQGTPGRSPEMLTATWPVATTLPETAPHACAWAK